MLETERQHETENRQPQQLNLFQQDDSSRPDKKFDPSRSPYLQAKIKTKLQPDYEQAKKYLTLLNEGAESFTFQTFDDRKGGDKRKNLTRILNGSVEDCWDDLVTMNKQGAGVFVTVNETNLAGRKKTDIIKIRAVWQEDDNKGAKELPIDPHLVVESSPGKYHRYILTETTQLDEFEPVQQVLVNLFGSDPNAKDRSRVLRLPGFFHQKNPKQPHMVRIVHESGAQVLSWDKVKKYFSPDSNGQAEVVTTTEPKRTDVASHTRSIHTGENYHGSLLSLAASFIGQGVKSNKVKELLQGIMDGCPDTHKDQRWQDRRDDIHRIVASAVAKFGKDENQNLQPQSPMALRRKDEQGEPFPVYALGSGLAETCEVMMNVIKAPAALCAQSLLAAVNLAAQAHRNVIVDGRESPLSLFFCLIAVSGERKSEVDKATLQPHREYEQTMLGLYHESMKEYQIEKETFEARKKKIIRQDKSLREQQEKLAELYSQKNNKPTNPTILVTDFSGRVGEGMKSNYLSPPIRRRTRGYPSERSSNRKCAWLRTHRAPLHPAAADPDFP